MSTTDETVLWLGLLAALSSMSNVGLTLACHTLRNTLSCREVGLTGSTKNIRRDLRALRVTHKNNLRAGTGVRVVGKQLVQSRNTSRLRIYVRVEESRIVGSDNVGVGNLGNDSVCYCSDDARSWGFRTRACDNDVHPS